MEYKGVKFYFNESPAIKELVNEIFSDNYRVFDKQIKFSKGDIVLDLGANEGIFSIMMAKLFPEIKVFAVEPVPSTFYRMIRNIGSNGVTNIIPLNIGVGKESGVIDMVVCNNFSGGSSGVQQAHDTATNHIEQVEVISLDNLCVMNGIEKIRLLKVDIEGMEYETLYNTKVLERVDYFVGEFHINTFLINKGYDIRELATYVGSKTNLTFYKEMKMAE